MKTKWEGHYTGIDVLDLQHWKVIHPYFQRDLKTKQMQFVRICFSAPWKRHWLTLGLFIGRQNYARSYVKGGFQIFTDHFTFGIGSPKNWPSYRKPLIIDYSGSMVDPYYHVSFILFNRFVFGFDTPKWFKNWKHEQDMKRWEEMPDPPGMDDYYDDGTMTDPEQER